MSTAGWTFRTPIEDSGHGRLSVDVDVLIWRLRRNLGGYANFKEANVQH